MRRHRRPERAAPALLLAFALACTSPEPPPPAAEEAAPPPAAPLHPVTLLYVEGASGLLAPCEASLPSAGTPEEAYAALLTRYLEGPACPGLDTPFAERTALRAVYALAQGRVVVDLTGQAMAGGGSATESLRVYGLVDTLKVNFPEITSVRLLVEGREVETLLGHIDLQHPLPPEPSLLTPAGRALLAPEAP